jgi:nitroimidazol reductase NimA-like FMN-containing flavoprotein (pyridoxamine 5'-phosphate oxidase superfamily)
MTWEERDAFLREQRTLRVATASPDGRPHISPLYFAWDGESMWMYSLVRSQRWADLQRNPRCSVVVDAGNEYSELRGVELYGEVEVVGEVPRVGDPNPQLDAVETLLYSKYGRGEVRHDGRHAWLRLRPQREFSWDFRKLIT